MLHSKVLFRHTLEMLPNCAVKSGIWEAQYFHRWDKPCHEMQITDDSYRPCLKGLLCVARWMETRYCPGTGTHYLLLLHCSSNFFLCAVLCQSLKPENSCSKMFFQFLVMKSHIFTSLSSKNPKQYLLITKKGKILLILLRKQSDDELKGLSLNHKKLNVELETEPRPSDIQLTVSAIWPSFYKYQICTQGSPI